MTHLTRSNGRAESEVIVNFADGLAYSKTKLEEAYRNGLLEKPVKPPKALGGPVKKDDLELIAQELEIPKARAEKALIEHHGDVAKALEALILP